MLGDKFEGSPSYNAANKAGRNHFVRTLSNLSPEPNAKLMNFGTANLI
jgi:hypothetical protein